MSEQRFSGLFGASAPAEHYGELTVDGADTVLRLIGKNLSSMRDANVLYGETIRAHVSCIDCIWTGTTFSLGEVTHAEQGTVFPHYVTQGQRFFDPATDRVEALTFRFTDIDLLFGDSDSVGSFLASQELSEAVLTAARKGAVASPGAKPVISYFDGHVEAWALDSEIGKISIRNMVTVESARPFTHNLEMSVRFSAPVDLKKSMDYLLLIRQGMSILAGRAQALEGIKLTVHDPETAAVGHRLLRLSWSLSPSGPPKSDAPPRPFAFPLDLRCRSEEFSAVLSKWFARAEAWNWPRARYVRSLEAGQHYSDDRLIAAANMFDLIPDSEYPAPEPLAPEILEAAAQVRALFKGLPDSIERNSVLGTIARFGKLSLPKKVICRGDIVLSHLGSKLPGLQKVLKAAVLCRNHFVHGSDFDLHRLGAYMHLMTDALEFVFVASELIELGWDARSWASHGNSGGHRLTDFLATYATTIDDFLSAYEGQKS